jgi:hypothetical protein
LRSADSFNTRLGRIPVLRGELVVSAKNEDRKSRKGSGGGDGGKSGRSVGDALRRAYDATVSEAVPDDLLDLLKKLD